METTTHIQQTHSFCINKREKEIIHTKYDDWGYPDVCFIAERYEKEYLLVYLDAYDYYAYYCYKTPIEDIMDIDQKENEYLLKRLNPKVININKRDMTLFINNKTIKLRIRTDYESSPILS